jgi:hypothetical protein
VAAIDVNFGPTRLHRRVVVWQDEDRQLVVSDSGYGTTNLYAIREKLQGDVIGNPIEGTPIDGTADDTGAVHVFYLHQENEDKDEAIVGHLIQYEMGEWAVGSLKLRASPESFLSSAWHANESDSSLVLGYQSAESGEVELILSRRPRDNFSDSNSWHSINMHDTLGLFSIHQDNHGHALISGVLYDGESDEENSAEPPMSSTSPALHLALEGYQQITVAECSFAYDIEGSPEARCLWLNRTFSGKHTDFPN